MRLTILINGAPSAVKHEYAVLWLDTDKQLWSRESHDGIDLPPWGKMHDEKDAVTLCSPNTNVLLCTLSGLHVDGEKHIPNAQGTAQWCCPDQRAATNGEWRIQAVDRQTILPEDSVFTKGT